MFSAYYPETNEQYFRNIYDPFRAWKYEQEMRRRQQAMKERRLQHEAYEKQQRRHRPKEQSRRDQLKQQEFRQLQEMYRLGYHVIQDWDGQLYLVPPRAHARMNNTEYPVVSVDEDRNKSPIREVLVDTNVMSPSNTSFSNDNSTLPSRKTAVLVENVSDTDDDDDDAGTALERTLRSRRPSPGQWLEPVECVE